MVKKRYRKTAISQYASIAIAFTLILAFSFLSYYITSNVQVFDVFAIPWAAGRSWLLKGVNPYENSVIDSTIQAITDSQIKAHIDNQKAFHQPLFSLFFYLPFSLMPFSVARTLWVTILAIFVGLIGVLGIRIAGWKLNLIGRVCVILVLIFSLPGAITLLRGHISPIIIGMGLSSIYLLQKKHDTAAGFILAFASSYFLTIGLVISVLLLWAIIKKRWKFVVSFLSGLAFLIIISFLILPSWFLDWASVLVRLDIGWSWIKTPLMVLAALLPGISNPLTIFLHGLFAIFTIIILISLLIQSDQSFVFNIFLLFIVAYFLHLQSSIVFHYFIIPGLLLIFRYWSDRWKHFGFALSWIFLLIGWLGPWLFFFSEISSIEPMENSWIYIGYPLIAFIGMIWIRWWAVKLPKPSFQS